MASFGATVLDRMTSEISRLRAISSLHDLLAGVGASKAVDSTYRLLPVAFSICSSSAVLAELDHQDIILKRACGRLARFRKKRKATGERATGKTSFYENAALMMMRDSDRERVLVVGG